MSKYTTVRFILANIITASIEEFQIYMPRAHAKNDMYVTKLSQPHPTH